MGRGEIYQETRERVAELVRSLDADELARPVPATPAWTPKDVVAHLTGVVADITTGNVATAGSDAWTAAQVEARRERTVEEILAEWWERAPALEAFLDSAPPDMSAILISDCYAHEQDIRGATGRVGAREVDALKVALDYQIDNLGWRIEEADLPGLKLRAGEMYVWRTMQPDIGATVNAPDRFELFRSLHGRRSRGQLAAMSWEGEGPDRYLDVFARFALPEQDIVE